MRKSDGSAPTRAWRRSARILSAAVATAFTSAFVREAAAQAYVNALDRGWNNHTGYHESENDNYFVGHGSQVEYANWFAFNIPSFPRAAIGATFSAWNPANDPSSSDKEGYGGDTTETYTLFDVSTPVTSLRAGGTGLFAIHNDLKSGTSYGSRTVSAADNGTLVQVPLNSTALAAINAARGSTFATGGFVTSIAGTANQFLFSGTGGFHTARLELTFAPVVGIFRRRIVSSCQQLEPRRRPPKARRRSSSV